jgi:hypothetical protein
MFLAAPIDGCASTHNSCAMIACSSSLRVDVISTGKPFAPGDYVVERTTAGKTVSELCTIRSDRSTGCGGVGEIAAMGTAPDGMTLFLTWSDAPAQFTLKITFGTAMVVNRAFDVTYETYYPNGPSCEPTCKTAYRTVNRLD